MKIGNFILAMVAVILLPVISFASPISVSEREALVDGPFLTRNGKVLRITVHQLDIRVSGDKTFKWAVAIERELEKAGWTACSPREINIVVYVSGLTSNGITSGNTFVASVKSNGDYTAKRVVDNTQGDFAAQVTKAVNQVIRGARIGWFLDLITGTGEK